MKRIVSIVCVLSVFLLLTSCTRTSIIIPRGYEGIFQTVSNLNWAFVVAIFLAEVTLGWLCLYIAWRKGYSTVGFFFFGFFLFIPAIIVLACLKPKGKIQTTSSQQVNVSSQANKAPIPAELDTNVYEPSPVIPVWEETLTKVPHYDSPAKKGDSGKLPEPSNPTEEELMKFLKLKERGVITEEEYKAMRKKVLGL